MVTRSKFLWPGSERRHCRICSDGVHTVECLCCRSRATPAARAALPARAGTAGVFIVQESVQMEGGA